MSFRQGLALSVLLASSSQLAAYIAVPALPVIGRDLGDISGEWVVAAYLVVVAGSQLVWGPLSDGLGRRRTILAGVAAGIVGSVVCAVATSGIQLIAGRCIQAAGFASCLVNSRAILRDRFGGEDLTRAIASTTVWIAVIPTLTPATGGALTSGFGWRAPFVFTAVAAIALFVVLVRNLADASERTAVRFGEYARCVRNRKLLLGSLAGGCHFGALTALTVGGPEIARRVAGLGPTEVGLLISALTPMFIAGAALTRARPGLAAKPAVLGCLALQIGCVAALLLVLSSGGGWLVVGLALVGAYAVLQGILLPALMSRTLGRSGAGAGISASLFGSIQLMGGGVAAWLTPVFGERFDVLGAGSLMLVLLVGTAAFVRLS